MWSDKSKADVLVALGQVERAARALLAQVEFGAASPDECLPHLERMKQDIAWAVAAASWDKFPEDAGS